MALYEARLAAAARRGEPLSWRSAVALWFALSGIAWGAVALLVLRV